MLIFKNHISNQINQQNKSEVQNYYTNGFKIIITYIQLDESYVNCQECPGHIEIIFCIKTKNENQLWEKFE